MKIHNVHVTNWKAPGATWWELVERNSHEPLIDATIQMTLSCEEYKELLDKDKKCRDFEQSSGVASSGELTPPKPTQSNPTNWPPQ